jgi:hypothetical protein
LGIIQQAISEVKIINYLIGHGKIYCGKIATNKLHIPKGNKIDFGFFEIAFVKGTFYKYYTCKIANCKITVFKNAGFKFFVSNSGFVKYAVG